MLNTDEYDDMPELTDSEPDAPTVQESPSQVQSTVVPSVLAKTHSSFPDLLHYFQLRMWVQWFLANLHESGNHVLSGTHRFMSMKCFF